MAASPAAGGPAQPLGPVYGTSGLTYTPWTENMAYSGDSPWLATTGSAPTFVASDPNLDHEPYMSLANGLARADIPQTVSREASLSFRALHSAFSRGLWVGLFDESGRRGYALRWDSAQPAQWNNGEGALELLKFDLTQSIESYGSWSAMPPGQPLGSQVASGHLAVYGPGNYAFAKLQLNWNAATNQLTIVAGDNATPRLTVTDSAGWANGWVPAFRRVYVRGNTDSYVDDLSVTMGRALQVLDGGTYIDERFSGSPRNGTYAADPFAQIDQPWTLLEGGATIAADLNHPGVAQLPAINVHEQGDNAMRELRLRFGVAGTRAATPIATPLPAAASSPLVHISYDIRRETGDISGGVYLVSAPNASGGGGRGVGFLTEMVSTNTLRLKVYTTSDSGDTSTSLGFVTLATPQPISNRIFPVAFEWDRVSGAVSAAVDGGSWQAIELTAAQRADLATRASFSHAVVYSFGTQLRLDNVLVTGMPLAYVTSGADVQAAVASAAGTSHKTVYLPPGEYTHAGLLTIDGVRVIGAGNATRLIATNPVRSRITLTGLQPALRRLTRIVRVPDSDYVSFAARKAARDDVTSTEFATNLRVLQAQNALISDVVVERARRGGILVQYGTGVDLVANTVTETLADGIHLTHGTSGGRVFNNHVHFTGDDLIAVVSYRHNRENTAQYEICRDDSVFHNVGTYNFWARGLTIIGGTRIALENNRITRTMGANLTIASESSYFTYGVSDSSARGNLLTDSRGAAAAIDSPGTSDDGMPAEINQPAVHLDGYSGYPLERVRIIGNTIERSAVEGVRARAGATATELELLDNVLWEIYVLGRANVAAIHVEDFDAGPLQVRGNVLHSATEGTVPRYFIYNLNPASQTNQGYGNIWDENAIDGPPRENVQAP